MIITKEMAVCVLIGGTVGFLMSAFLVSSSIVDTVNILHQLKKDFEREKPKIGIYIADAEEKRIRNVKVITWNRAIEIVEQKIKSYY